MFDALGRLFASLDAGMLVVAIATGLAAALCLFRLRSRMRYSRGAVRLAWIFLCSIVGGVGAWAGEMTALASLHPGLAIGFDPVGVLGSLMVSVLCAACGFAIAWTGQDRMRTATGGLVLAISSMGMHLVAVGSIRMAATVAWQPILLWLGFVLAAGAYMTSLVLAGSAKTFAKQLVGAGGCGFAMLALFFVSLSGLEITPDPTLAQPAGLIGQTVVTFIAVVLSVLTTVGGLGAAYIDDVSSRSALVRSRRLADAAREGIVVLGAGSGVVLDCNAAFSALAGEPVESLVGRRLDEFLTLEGGAALELGPTVEGTLRGKDGEGWPVEVHARPLHEVADGAPATTVVSVRDLREHRATQDRLRFLAEHDPLTGLPNREMMNRRLEERISEGAILTMVRVVNHAEINSLYGHAVGDAVLVKMAERLRRFAANPLPGYDCMPVRLGGAELALVVVGVTNLSAAEAFTSALTKSLGRPVRLEAQAVEPQVRLGISAAPDDAATAPEIVRHAEVALESAARDGASGGVVYFRQDLQDEVVAQRTLLEDLKVGIAQDQLVVHYQPQARTSDGGLCGFEALVRWIHPTRGFMPPDSFIPAAEQSGLIVELGEQVLRRACREAAAWPHPVPVAVNLSPLQVGQTDLPRLVHQILIETGLSPARLELEITESALFRDYQRALDTLRRLKALGVKIAMDDFGTGFSSLSTLQSFPFDKIKIDKSFVNGVGALERSTVIVKAVLGIGKGLDIPVVAEGVETAEQMAFLRDEGCAVVQGYHIGKPAPIGAHQALFDALDAPAARPRRLPRVAAVA